MNKGMTIAAALTALAAPAAAMQQQGQSVPTPPRTVPSILVLYELRAYNGRSYTVDGPNSRTHTDWNVGSLTIHPGDRWQICARPRFRDPCIILDRSVHDASLIGVDGQIGSIRPAPAESGN